MEERLEYRIFTYSAYLLNKFGKKVFRVGLSTWKMCPHREKIGGCIFCNPTTFTGDYQSADLSVNEQLNDAIPRIKKACGDIQLLAYFQDETSTYGSIEFLKSKYDQALSHPEVIGLVVSTRPDYINKGIAKLLASYKVPVTIEIGMQSIHNSSLEFLNRGHTFKQVEDSIRMCGEAGLTVGVHLILGIPDETFSDMLQTIKWISSNKYIKQVKFHNLVVYKNTKLAEMKKNPVYTIEEHIRNLGELVPYIRSDIAVSRLFTSNIQNPEITMSNFNGNKTKWMNELRKYLYKNNLNQGSRTEVEYNYRRYYK